MPVYKSSFLVAALVTLTCVSTPVVAQNVPDVTGIWFTRHQFDISQAVPPALAEGFAPLTELGPRIVAAVKLRQEERSLEPVIAKQVALHVSPSLPAVLRIGKGMPAIVSTLRSDGTLHVAGSADLVHVEGSEVWTSLVFYWLGLCGDNIGGDPEEPPECARFDIATSDNDNPSEPSQCKGQSIPSINVPLSGTLRPSGQSPQWELVVDDRMAVIPAARLLVRMTSELLQRTTPWHCIDEATDCASGQCLVDCAGLAKDVAEQAPQLDVDRVEQACVRAVRKAGRDTRHALIGGWADVALLRYNGVATVGVGTLDGYWKGTFQSKVIKSMPGAWHATRKP